MSKGGSLLDVSCFAGLPTGFDNFAFDSPNSLEPENEDTIMKLYGSE